MEPPSIPRSGEGGTKTSPLRFDRAQWVRSIRFTLTVMAPILVTLATGPRIWLVYAMVSGIVSFAGDAGGRFGPRLLWMATGPFALTLGLILGALTTGHPSLVLGLSMLAGLAYGLVETAHPHLLLATRFFAFGIVLAGLVSPPVPVDYLAVAIMLVVAWLISIASEWIDGVPCPLTVPPFSQILPSLQRNALDRWTFGFAVALAIALALTISAEVGAVRPSWSCLAVLLVMRSEVVSSLRLGLERVAGTLGGVIAAVLITQYGNHRGILVAMAVLSFIRWPAQQVHNALGVFCLTAFVLLLVELVTPDSNQAVQLLHERFSDTLIGAAAAGLGLLIYRGMMRHLDRPPRQ